MNEKYRRINHAGDGALPNGMKNYCELCCVEPVMKLKLEDGELNVRVNYDAYQTSPYGD